MPTRQSPKQIVMDPFLDWYSVWAGNVGYEDDGRAWATDTPSGVRLSVQTPEISEPVLAADEPWEQPTLAGASKVLREDGKSRMWYNVSPVEERREAIVCYAESDDGYEWEKPSLGLCEFGGNKDNNIVYKGTLGSVFRDPRAQEDERYKAIVRRSTVRYQGKTLQGNDWVDLKQDLLARGLTEGEIWQKEVVITGSIYGSVSPDGLRWKQIEKPFMEARENPWDANYDTDREAYVAHFVPVYGGRRCISRAETKDFRRWHFTQHILRPDGQFSPSDDFYSSCNTPYPGGRYVLDFYAFQNAGEYHLMFPSVFHRDRDVVEPYLAVSRDDLNWVWPEMKPIIPREKEGAEEEGQIYMTPDLVPFDDTRWGMLFTTTSTNHNDQPASDASCVYRLAFWQCDRLVAIEAVVEGHFTLVPRICKGNRLVLNYKTATNGWIKAELIDPALFPPSKLEALKGFGFEECEPLRGDSLEGEVRWKGNTDLSRLKDQHICVRIRMFKAKLFALSI